MAGSNLMLEAILSTGLTADPIQNWREDIPYVWAEQQYGDPSRAFAKYLFTYHETAEQWRTWSEWGDHFVSDVIEPVYFRLANDISWNIYWISVLKGTEKSRSQATDRLHQQYRVHKEPASFSGASVRRYPDWTDHSGYYAGGIATARRYLAEAAGG